jgi:hypothetical protein
VELDFERLVHFLVTGTKTVVPLINIGCWGSFRFYLCNNSIYSKGQFCINIYIYIVGVVHIAKQTGFGKAQQTEPSNNCAE